MDSDGLSDCIIIVVFLLIKAFYSAAEYAVTETSDAKVKSFENGTGNQKRLFKLLQKPSRLRSAFMAENVITTALLYSIGYGNFAENLKTLFPPEFQLLAKIVCLAALVLIQIICCAILPKRLVNDKNCEAIAVGCAPVISATVFLLTPITALSRLLSTKNGSEKDSVTEEEILMMVDVGNETGVIEEDQKEMINNIFDFDDLRVSDVMTHRTDIVAVGSDAAVSDVLTASIDSGFSRIPVYRDSIDHIVGIICVKDLLCMVGADTGTDTKISGFVRDTIYIPETVPCGKAFRQLCEHKMQLAVIIDEYGGTAGVITTEDIVESIVGNIQDEYDDETEEIVKTSDGTFIIDGTASPEDVFPTLELTEADNFDTVSGFIVSLLGRIPEKTETPSVTYENIRFTVLVVEDMCITRLKAEILPNSAEKEDK